MNPCLLERQIIMPMKEILYKMINASIIFSAKMALDTCMIILCGGRSSHANTSW